MVHKNWTSRTPLIIFQSLHQIWTNELALFERVTVATETEHPRGTARNRRSSPPATVSGDGNELRASPRHPEHTVLTN